MKIVRKRLTREATDSCCSMHSLVFPEKKKMALYNSMMTIILSNAGANLLTTQYKYY